MFTSGRVRLLTGVLFLSVIARAGNISAYGYIIDGLAIAACQGTPDSYGSFGIDLTGTGVGDHARSSTTCPGPDSVVTTALAQSSVIENLQVLSGMASVTNGSQASSDASYYDTVTVSPLPDTDSSSVTVGVAANYHISLSGVNPLLGRDGTVTMTLNVSPFATPVQQILDDVTLDGDLSGVLETPNFKIINCNPCTFGFSVEGKADVEGGIPSPFGGGGTVAATYSDPVTIDVPPGWTYTLASQQASPGVPEPGALVLVGMGLVALGCIRRRRRE